MILAGLLISGCSESPTWVEDGQGIRHKTLEGSWRALEAMSPDEAWVAGSTGQWARILRGDGITGMHLFADNVVLEEDSSMVPHYRGIAVLEDAVIGTAIASPGFIRRALRDDDGHPALPRATAWRSDDPAVFLDAIIALDDSGLVAMGDPIDGCLCVLRSGNGGRSWSRVPCAVKDGPGVPASREGEAAFAASNGNLASSGDSVWMLSGGGASRVYRSLDRGRTWDVFDTPLLQGGTMTGGFSMDFADASTGIVWGGDWEDKEGRTGRGAVTGDGGATWTLIAEGRGPGYASSVRYRPASGGLQLVCVGSPGGVDLSDDGGRNWRHFSDSAFYAARFSPDGSTLWLSGNGKIARVEVDRLGW